MKLTMLSIVFGILNLALAVVYLDTFYIQHINLFMAGGCFVAALMAFLQESE